MTNHQPNGTRFAIRAASPSRFPGLLPRLPVPCSLLAPSPSNSPSRRFLLALFAVVLLAAGTARSAESDASDFRGAWYITPGAGFLFFQGGHPSRDGWAGTLRAGRDVSELFSIEAGGIYGAPDTRNGPRQGRPAPFGGVWMDAVFHFGGWEGYDRLCTALVGPLAPRMHFSRWERFDPFLTLGAGACWSGRRALPGDDVVSFVPRLGAGFQYHLTEHWSVRAECTAMTTRECGFPSLFGMAAAGLVCFPK